MRSANATCIAYVANLFPSPVEPYVIAEIAEFTRRGIALQPCSMWHAPAEGLPPELREIAARTLYVLPLDVRGLLQALLLCLKKSRALVPFLGRILHQGKEKPGQRLRAIAHTLLGASLAVRLRDQGVQHIHVHHGYFGSWAAMIAAKLLGISCSMTLHGSDLLLHATFLDTKLQNCAACFTVSEYNRQYILKRFPRIDAGKIRLTRMGVLVGDSIAVPPTQCRGVRRNSLFRILSVGRLHPVKDHAFLLQACVLLRTAGYDFECSIAGEGPERKRLEDQIRLFDLSGQVRLLGQVSGAGLETLYRQADVVVLTSRSEGIPLVLMEAMALGKPVIAPAITGIPELVLDGKTGLLYEPGSVDSLVQRIEQVWENHPNLSALGMAARNHIALNFNAEVHLHTFADSLVNTLARQERSLNESALLQQVQRSV